MYCTTSVTPFTSIVVVIIIVIISTTSITTTTTTMDTHYRYSIILVMSADFIIICTTTTATTTTTTTTTTGHDVCDSVNYRSLDSSCELNTHPDTGISPEDPLIVADNQWVYWGITSDLLA